MAGINLSESIAPKRPVTRRSMMDRSFFWVVLFTVLVLLAWGGLRFMLYTTEKKIAGLQSGIDAAAAQLSGDAVDRVAQVDSRMSKLTEYAEQGEEMRKAIETLESLTIGSVRLDNFAYGREEGTVTIGGTTDNFRNLGQQVINYKSSDLFSDIRVENVSTTEDGRVGFSLVASLVKEEVPVQAIDPMATVPPVDPAEPTN